MKSDYVKDWMNASVITVTADVTLPDAHQIMKDRNIRRLPVVDEHGKLIGIVARSDVREAQPSDASTLSIYEMHYLLAKLTVKRIMTAGVKSVNPDTTIADTAKIMLDHKIGCLPVVDGDNKVVGIITESDIFRLIVKKYTE